MSKRSSENSKTTSTETLDRDAGLTTDEILARLREAYPSRESFVQLETPVWYMTTGQFMDLVTDVVLSLPWTSRDERPGHPEDIAVNVSMAVDTVSATISAMSRAGILKYRGQP